VVLAAATATTFALVRYGPLTDPLGRMTGNRRGGWYQTLAGVGGAFLGFGITPLAIVLALAPGPRLQVFFRRFGTPSRSGVPRRCEEPHAAECSSTCCLRRRHHRHRPLPMAVSHLRSASPRVPPSRASLPRLLGAASSQRAGQQNESVESGNERRPPPVRLTRTSCPVGGRGGVAVSSAPPPWGRVIADDPVLEPARWSMSGSPSFPVATRMSAVATTSP
jgi:hypothetical protein